MSRIALIHATPLAITPIEDAFAARWPEAERVNLLDDSLSADRSRSTALTPQLFERFAALTDYATMIGAAGVLFTCSAFGPAIDAAAERFGGPVLKPNAAMFEAALAQGRQIGLLSSFAPSLAPMRDEFDRLVADAGADAVLTTACAPDAMETLRRGNGERHDALLADEAARSLSACDVIMLAQFSTARAQSLVQDRTGCTVLTSPESAVLQLRESLAE